LGYSTDSISTGQISDPVLSLFSHSFIFFKFSPPRQLENLSSAIRSLSHAKQRTNSQAQGSRLRKLRSTITQRTPEMIAGRTRREQSKRGRAAKCSREGAIASECNIAATPHNRSAQSLGRKVEPSRRMPLISSSLTLGRLCGEGQIERASLARAGDAWGNRKATRPSPLEILSRGSIGRTDGADRLVCPG
jgi:hypothetical protein